MGRSVGSRRFALLEVEMDGQVYSRIFLGCMVLVGTCFCGCPRNCLYVSRVLGKFTTRQCSLFLSIKLKGALKLHDYKMNDASTVVNFDYVRLLGC